MCIWLDGDRRKHYPKVFYRTRYLAAFVSMHCGQFCVKTFRDKDRKELSGAI
jgi:hypothetical protein